MRNRTGGGGVSFPSVTSSLDAAQSKNVAVFNYARCRAATNFFSLLVLLR